ELTRFFLGRRVAREASRCRLQWRATRGLGPQRPESHPGEAMTKTTVWVRIAVCSMGLAGMVTGLAVPAGAQGPVQFQSDLRIRDLDGGTGTAKLYVGAAKQRMDF